ncbi:MAG TPA: dephospho-CoA kinase [Verrucomicrobiae bacterium]
MRVIGLTGGIGMGKSTSARLLVQRGLPVIDTDQIARELVEPGLPALEEIARAFGREILDASGALRRGELAQRVFADAKLRQQLEAILHPRIRSRWLSVVAQWRGERKQIGFVVIPLLFETHAEPEFSSIICVACSSASQAIRLKQRGWSALEAGNRVRAQWPIETKMAASEFVVWSEPEMELHRRQLDLIVNHLT